MTTSTSATRASARRDTAPRGERALRGDQSLRGDLAARAEAAMRSDQSMGSEQGLRSDQRVPTDRGLRAAAGGWRPLRTRRAGRETARTGQEHATAHPAGGWLAPPPVEAYVLHARDGASLAAMAGRIADLAPALSDGELRDLACQLGRDGCAPGGFRLGIVASGQQQLGALAREAARLVASLKPGELAARPGIFAGRDAGGRVVLLLPGLAIGQDSPGEPAGCTPPPLFGLTDPQAVQPAILHASLSGLRWLDRLGLTAAAAVGHSLGEITGLVWAGCLTESEATRLVAQRSAVLSASGARQTAMVSVAADAGACQRLCAGTDLVIAAYNGPSSHVLAGSVSGAREVTRRAEQQGIRAIVLDVSHAFHSPAMAGCAAPLRSILADIRFARPRRRLISTVTGREITAADDIPALLCAALTQPVRFTDALAAVAADADLLCETGPGHGLAALAASGCAVPTVSLEARTGDDRGPAHAAAALFAAGAVHSLEPMLTGRSSQPVDIWQERIVIPAALDKPNGTVTPATADGTAAPASADGIETPGTPDDTATPATADGTATPAIPDGPVRQATADGTAAPASADGIQTPGTADDTATPATVDGTVAPASADGTETPGTADGTATPALPDGPVTPGTGHGTAPPVAPEGVVTSMAAHGAGSPGRGNAAGAARPSVTTEDGAADVIPISNGAGPAGRPAGAAGQPVGRTEPADDATGGPAEPAEHAAGPAERAAGPAERAAGPVEPAAGAAGQADSAGAAPAATAGDSTGSAGGSAGTAAGSAGAEATARAAPPPAAARPTGPEPQGRFVEEIRLHRPGAELIAESRLSPGRDPYLLDYRAGGQTLLPAVMSLEAMAQAAAALAGQPLRHAGQVTFAGPVVVRPDTLIRVCAKREGNRVTTVLRSRHDGQWTDHCRAVFQPDAGTGRAGTGQAGNGGPAAGGAPGWRTSEPATALLDSADLYGPVCFQRGRFRRVAFLPELTSRRVRALVRGDDDQPWFGAEPGAADASLQLGSPGLNDATLHVLQACFPHRRMLPAGCDAVTVSGRQVHGAVEVTAIQRSASRPAARPLLARVQDADTALAAAGVAPPGPAGSGAPGEYLWDVAAVDASGQEVISWTGLRLRDAGPVPGHPALPPALLGVYLERGATALGLDPGLRINVRCEPPSLGPAAAGAPWLPALAASPRRPGWVSARSCGQLDELSLRLRAASPAACAWQTADLEDDVRGLERDSEDPEFATLRQRLRDSLAEPALTLHARIRTAIECLSKAGRPVGCELAVDGCYDDGWALLHAGEALIACTSVRVIGVSYPVAVSIMTGTGLHAAGAA